MRSGERQKVTNIKIDFSDPNCEKIDINKGEKRFNLLIAKMISGIETIQVKPGQLIVNQSDAIKEEEEYI